MILPPVHEQNTPQVSLLFKFAVCTRTPVFCRSDLDIIRGDHRSDVRLRQTGRRTSANSTIRGQDQGQANEEVAEGTLYYKQKATTFISHSAPHLGNTTACYQDVND
ncbi:hypothetical protein MRX96_003107 [Rhipicephalus microplus]